MGFDAAIEGFLQLLSPDDREFVEGLPKAEQERLVEKFGNRNTLSAAYMEMEGPGGSETDARIAGEIVREARGS